MLRLRKPRVGLWLDRSGATVVRLDRSDTIVVQHVASDVDSRVRAAGGRKSGTKTQDVTDEKRAERRHRSQLDRYYARLVEMLRGAEGVLILGPGETRLGLERAIQKLRGPAPHRVTVRKADKMTERQLVAAVRAFFARD